jgi:hypothetical protein
MKYLGLFLWTAFFLWLTGEVYFWIFISIIGLLVLANMVISIIKLFKR